ncbi:hypothetical protein [Streptomyces sp. NPDC002994]|uniref:hypothetical protein n=1 Tax=Streptomyces sp. NPDC002994 TaxID=3154441 RepID=UPI0033ADBA43
MDLPKIVARRSEEGWELEIAGLGPAYVKRLSDVSDHGRALMQSAGVTGADHGVQVTVDLGDELNERIKSATQATIDAHRAQLEAAAEMRRTTMSLKGHGMTGRDIAFVLGISPQRVSQLLSDQQL